MISLVLIVLFGLVFGYFATQNTQAVTLTFWEYSVPGVPLYWVVIGSLATGLLLTTIVGLITAWSAKHTIHKKEHELKKAEEEKTELTKRVHKLELENVKYKTESGTEDTDENSI